MSLTTTLVFCSATSQKHKCINSICNSLLIPFSSFSLCLSLFPWAFLWIFLIPLLYNSCSCFIPPLLLFQSFVTSNLAFSVSHSDPVTSISFDLPVLYFPIDLLAMGTPFHSIWFFLWNLHPSIPPPLPALSLFSSPFLSLSVSLGKAAFRLGFSRPRCEFWRRNDQRSWLCWSLSLGQILHPIPPEWNLVLPVSPPSLFSSSRTTPAKRRGPRQPKISNSTEGKFGGGAGQ